MSNQYIPAIDNFNAVEAFVRRVYNPHGDPALDARLSIQPYAYRVFFTDLAPDEPQQKIFNVAANADFVLTAPRYHAAFDGIIVGSVNTQDVALSSDIVPLVTILLTDTGSQEQLMSEAVDLMSYFGHPSSAPFELTYPRIISGRSGMSVQVNNYSSIMDGPIAPVTYSRLELTFAGVLVRGF